MDSRRLGLVALIASSRLASAGDDPDALTAQGEELAKTGEYTRAIELWKRADAVKPSAHHACLIGLAYTRRELWSQAEIFFDRCEHGASTSDPLPEWFADARAQLDTKLHDAGIAEVDVRVIPETSGALLAISSFPPGETFVPRKLHLVPGTYDVTATAPGFRPAHVAVTPKLGEPTVVTIRLLPTVTPPTNFAPWVLAGAGVLAIAGGVFHVLGAGHSSALADANVANDPAAWDAHHGAFVVDRDLAIGCYAAAAIVGTIGVVMYVRHRAWEPTINATTDGTPTIGVMVRR